MPAILKSSFIGGMDFNKEDAKFAVDEAKKKSILQMLKMIRILQSLIKRVLYKHMRELSRNMKRLRLRG